MEQFVGCCWNRNTKLIKYEAQVRSCWKNNQTGWIKYLRRIFSVLRFENFGNWELSLCHELIDPSRLKWWPMPWCPKKPKQCTCPSCWRSSVRWPWWLWAAYKRAALPASLSTGTFAVTSSIMRVRHCQLETSSLFWTYFMVWYCYITLHYKSVL